MATRGKPVFCADVCYLPTGAGCDMIFAITNMMIFGHAIQNPHQDSYKFDFGLAITFSSVYGSA